MSVSLPAGQIEIRQRNLPHWTCAGAVYWITFRLADALPVARVKPLRAEREDWIARHAKPWSPELWRDYHARFTRRVHQWLDAGYGACHLEKPQVREVVRACLMKFDGERLYVHAAVIMPNHVHALLEPRRDAGIPACDSSGEALSKLLKGIKGASAREINRLLDRQGRLWMDESYDHIVRSPAEYRHFLRYIRENPTKAGLAEGRYWLYFRDGEVGT